MASDERLRELEEKYEDYKVYDNQGSKIGKVDDLFIDESDREEYIGVKMGFFGMRSTLIPMEIVRVNEADRSLEVSETKDHVKNAPNFDDDDDITTEYEERIRSHFGLETHASSRGNYGSSSSDDAATGVSDEHTTKQRATGSDDVAKAHRPSDGSSETGASSEEPGSETERGETSEGPEETALGGETQGTPISRQTEETETFEEGGRTKIRRRIVREEIEDADQGTDRTG